MSEHQQGPDDGATSGLIGVREENGGLVSVHRCYACGEEFTVTPPAGDDWGGCLAETCPSYDPDRDVDIFFETAYKAGIIRREPK